MIVSVSGGLALAGLGLAAGTAQAGGPYRWCPGQDTAGQDGVFTYPGQKPTWNWGDCHTYYVVHYGLGNASPTIWDGADPPQPPQPVPQPAPQP